MKTNKNAETKVLNTNKKVESSTKNEGLTNPVPSKTAEESYKQLLNKTNEELNNMTREERSALLEKAEPMLSEEARCDLWEYNHISITRAINHLMEIFGRMPTKSEIASETGLSRVTVHKHLKDYKSHPLFLERDEQYKMLKGSMLKLLHSIAYEGNVNAIKLFMEVTGIISNNKTVNKNIIENQHNYIQINETRLSQDQIKKLSPERLKQIEELLKTIETT